MSPSWNTVPLGSVLRHRKQFIEIDDLATYKRCRVQTQAQGIVLRDIVAGTEVKTKRQQVCRAGEFLVAEIDAKVGGFGIVPPDLDGAIVSSHYFLFEVDSTQLDRRFLGWFIRTARFLDQVRAQGSTNYAAIRPSDVLSYKVPLPPLEEQRRIVTWIEALAGKIEESRRLGAQSTEQADALQRSVLRGAISEVPMRELVDLRPPDVVVDRQQIYAFAGVYSFGRGVFRGRTRLGSEFAYDRLTRLRAGDFVYPKLMAWEGALGVVPPESAGLVVSPEFPVFGVRQDVVLPEVLDVHFRDPSVWPHLSGASTGTNVRRRRLHPEQFLEYRMPLPARKDQLVLRSVVLASRQAADARAAAGSAIAALLPAALARAF